ncbi:O-aminophenol oxidase [compost metagenome]
MIRMTSPDDPVFFVHHCFIDKVWAQWQAKQALRAPDGEPYYWPERDGPPGHNFADMLTFGDNAPKKISELMSISALEYEYAPKQKVPDHQRSNPYL